MKKILNILRSLGIHKILIISGITAMFILVALGPSMLRASARVNVTTPTTTTAAAASKTTVGATNGTAIGFDPSTFNVTPITMPDGSITFPTYTVPTATYTNPKASNNSNAAIPDPSKCPSIQTAMDAVTAPYFDKDNQLRAEISSLEKQLIAMTTINRSQDTSPGIVYSLPDTTAMQNKLQADNNQLMNDIRDINNRLASYQVQFSSNLCNQ